MFEIGKIKKGKRIDMRLNQTKLKENNGFEFQLNEEYKIYQEDNAKEILEDKVKKELSLKSIKKKLNFLIYPSFIYVLYSIFIASSVGVTTFASFIVFIGAYFFYAFKKWEIKSVLELKDIKQIEKLSNKQFIESYASKKLIQAYKESYGEKQYENILFDNGSDEKKIKIKHLKN